MSSFAAGPRPYHNRGLPTGRGPLRGSGHLSAIIPSGPGILMAVPRPSSRAIIEGSGPRALDPRSSPRGPLLRFPPVLCVIPGRGPTPVRWS